MMAKQYLDVLIKDLNKDDLIVDSVYIGGGSPSSLDNLQFEELLKNARLHYSNKGQFCVEINPEDMNDEKIALLKKYDVNRVSIGVQTFNEQLLRKLNRHHDELMVRNVVNKLKNIGINNINCDLIYGLPNEINQNLKEDLDKLISLNIPHISTYALQVEDNTLFSIKKVEALDDDLQAEQYDFICNYLNNAGFDHYEISNFAKKGYESMQNLLYWKAKEYRGVGVASSGYESDVRYDTSYSLTSYIKGNINKNEHKLSILEKEFEYIMLNLRLKDGIDLKEYQIIFKYDFLSRFEKELKELLNNKLLIKENNRIFIPENKFFISNSIISKLLVNIDYL